VGLVIELELTAEAEEFGREYKRKQDEAGIGDRFHYAGRDKRWTGFAVEHALDEYLTQRGLPHVWNGGLDKKPDFEFGGGLGIASKANSGPGPDPGFRFVIPKDQASRLATVALFSIISVKERKIWVAGQIHSAHFKRVAELRRKGEEGFVPGRPLVNDCWVVRLRDLKDPEEFFKLLEVLRAA
jgi:hypothetical protein